jgi:glycerol uptake facilitator-like aquaporin
VIWGVSRKQAHYTPFAVGAYITAAYWFTASTSFANPAVTLARAASNTFAGIRPLDAPAFIVAQLAGALSATLLFGWLVPVSTHGSPRSNAQASNAQANHVQANHAQPQQAETQLEANAPLETEKEIA